MPSLINVITQFGSSFKGLSNYLNHDIGQANTSERVAWSATHNLATDEPERAWKIMAATAMSQAELKAGAGVANTGRKSHAHVMHYILSWHPDERDGLSQDEMMAAAKASMSYMGTYEGEKLGKKVTAKRTQHADEHQAVIVCHDDGPGSAPHIHIMLNRCHPLHGVMLPDSKDYEKLSAWALDYRIAQGKEDLCPQRTKNAAKKAQGIVTNNPRKPRNIYEQEQAIDEADPASRKKALLEQQARRAKELNAKDKAMKRRQVESMRALEDRHVAAERTERARATEAIRARTANIRGRYAPKVDALTDRQTAEREAFKEARGTAAGHVRNFMNAVKAKEWMREIRSTRLRALTHGMKLAVSSGFQENDMLARHRYEQGQLSGRRKAEQRAVTRGVRMDEGLKLVGLRQTFYEQRNDLLLKYGMDQAKLKAEWKQLDQDRLATVAEDERGRRAKASPGGPSGGLGQEEKEGVGAGVDMEVGTGAGGSGINLSPTPQEAPAVKDQFDQATATPQPGGADGGDERKRAVDAMKEKLKQARLERQKNRQKRPRPRI